MKIKNNLVLYLSGIALLLGIFDGGFAYQDEIDRILNYSTNYENFTKNFTLYIYLNLRYFKYIFLIQFFVIGFFGKFITVLVAMVKSYAYSFTLSLIIISFSGVQLIKKLLFVSVQMTLSLVVTVLFAQITMNFLQEKYPINKKHEIQLYAFVFSIICCIIIGTVDFIIIMAMNWG